MKIHHLSCGSFCLPSIPFLKTEEKRFCCHCLLLETESGLVLVDAGFSSSDLVESGLRTGITEQLLGAGGGLQSSALSQIREMGFSPNDVRHIVVTHLDPDHVGGIQDFPKAKVHLYRREYDSARELMEQKRISARRFRAVHWNDAKKWEFYDVEGDNWQGFHAVRPLRGLPEEIALLPLPGHTGGHCGVVVDTPARKLLHAGDAYYQRDEMDPDVNAHRLVSGFARIMAYDNGQRLQQLDRLRRLQKENPQVRVFCSHDLQEFTKLKNND